MPETERGGIYDGVEFGKDGGAFFNPCPAEPGYTLPLQTV